METRAHYVLIGAFVMIAVALAFMFVLWIGSAQREFHEYRVIFTERVSGLSAGSIVRFNGIQKGEVAELNIDPNDPGIVIALIRVDKDTPVKTDTKAELEPVGFTGLTIIQLVGGSADAPYLRDVSEERIPVLQADMSSVGVLFEGSGDVIARANELLSDENIQNITGIIADVRTITHAIAENDEDIDAILTNLNKITTDLAAATDKLEAASSGLQAFLEEDAPAVADELEALLNDSRNLVNELKSISSENRKSLKVFADQGLGQVAPALAEARRLMKSLDYMLREIDRDPRAYFLGEQAPEYSGADE